MPDVTLRYIEAFMEFEQNKSLSIHTIGSAFVIL